MITGVGTRVMAEFGQTEFGQTAFGQTAFGQKKPSVANPMWNRYALPHPSPTCPRCSWIFVAVLVLVCVRSCVCARSCWCVRARVCVPLCVCVCWPCETPEASGPPGLRTTVPELQTCTLGVPALQKHHQNSTRRFQRMREREKKRTWGGRGEKKKKRNFGPSTRTP